MATMSVMLLVAAAQSVPATLEGQQVAKGRRRQATSASHSRHATCCTVLSTVGTAAAAFGVRERRWLRQRARAAGGAVSCAAVGGTDDVVAQEFLRWAREQGIEVNAKLGFAPDDKPSGGRKVVCCASISKGEALVTLPVASAATVDFAEDAAAPGKLQPLKDWWVKNNCASSRLAAKMAFERERLEPYLAMLPALDEIQAPWRWSDEELRFLSSEVAELAVERREALEDASAELEALDCWTSSPRELFLRAYHGVTSRAFSGTDQAFSKGPGSDAIGLGVTTGAALVAGGAAFAGLVSVEAALLGATGVAAVGAAVTASLGSREVLSILPMVDQVNHASGPMPDLVLVSRSYQLNAHRAFSRGEEVVFSYGEKDNDSLLLQHGFIEEDNPSDAVSLPVTEDLEISEGTRAALEDASVTRLRFGRGGVCLALRPEDEDGFMRVDQAEGPLAEVAKAVLRVAKQEVEGGLLAEAKDGELTAAFSSAPPARAQLALAWRRERRRLVREAASRWL